MTVYFVIIVLGLVLDRFTKNYAVTRLMERPVSGKLFNFTYLENRGAAFGILQDKRVFFIILTITVMAILLYVFVKNFKTNKKAVNVALTLIISGALGNFYDRLVNNYVVDFIEFKHINFPVFNVADILISIGSCLLIIYILFFDGKGEKEENK